MMTFAAVGALRKIAARLDQAARNRRGAHRAEPGKRLLDARNRGRTEGHFESRVVAVLGRNGFLVSVHAERQLKVGLFNAAQAQKSQGKAHAGKGR